MAASSKVAIEAVVDSSSSASHCAADQRLKLKYDCCIGALVLGHSLEDLEWKLFLISCL